MSHPPFQPHDCLQPSATGKTGDVRQTSVLPLNEFVSVTWGITSGSGAISSTLFGVAGYPGVHETLASTPD